MFSQTQLNISVIFSEKKLVQVNNRELANKALKTAG